MAEKVLKRNQLEIVQSVHVTLPICVSLNANNSHLFYHVIRFITDIKVE